MARCEAGREGRCHRSAGRDRRAPSRPPRPRYPQAAAGPAMSYMVSLGEGSYGPQGASSSAVPMLSTPERSSVARRTEGVALVRPRPSVADRETAPRRGSGPSCRGARREDFGRRVTHAPEHQRTEEGSRRGRSPGVATFDDVHMSLETVSPKKSTLNRGERANAWTFENRGGPKKHGVG